MKKYTRGFTLIELLVVIAIIGILSSVVLVSLNSARTKAGDARVISDVQQVRTALETGYDGTGYPDLASNDFTGTAKAAGTPIGKLIADAVANSGAITVFTATASTSYAVYGKLPSKLPVLTYFCLDSKGGASQAANASSTITCP